MTAHIASGKLERLALSSRSSFELTFEGEESPEVIAQVKEWFFAYSEKKPIPVQIPLALPSRFIGNAMLGLSRIPFGETSTYGELAALLGNPKAARAVGTACRKNPFPILLPCHRILPKSGGLGNFAYGTLFKQLLLSFEKGQSLPTYRT